MPQFLSPHEFGELHCERRNRLSNDGRLVSRLCRDRALLQLQRMFEGAVVSRQCLLEERSVHGLGAHYAPHAAIHLHTGLLLKQAQDPRTLFGQSSRQWGLDGLFGPALRLPNWPFLHCLATGGFL